MNLWVPRELHDSIRPERVLAIMAFGYSERQARFLVHVLVHSGVFLERHYVEFPIMRSTARMYRGGAADRVHGSA